MKRIGLFVVLFGCVSQDSRLRSIKLAVCAVCKHLQSREMKSVWLLPSLFGLAIMCACGNGSVGSQANNLPSINPSPVIATITPSSTTPGSAALSVTVTGSGFVSGSVVLWNGSRRATTFQNSGQLAAELTSEDLVSAGTASIAVFNPEPGGGSSGSLTFSIEPDAGALWQMSEFVLNGQESYSNPFTDTAVTARFKGPNGQLLTMPAFYDGDGLWRVRFTPTATGTWQYSTNSTNSADKGLHGVSGSLTVGPAIAGNPLYEHGGFLRVSTNHRYLTYTDGTPFFWLGDVWTYTPSSLMPIDGGPPNFTTLVDKRSLQNYSVVHWFFEDAGWGHEWCCADNSTSVLAHQRRADPAYWRNVDGYFTYAQDHGLLPAFGLPARISDLTIDEWKFLWSYVLGRYAATPVTFLVMLEYNSDNDPRRVQTALAIGQHIKNSDPYQRAMTADAWAIWVEGRQAWSQAWYDFIMVEGGHWSPPLLAPATSFQFAYNSLPTRPMLDGESEFEGILGYGATPNAVVTPEQTRRAAYYSIQLGGFGYTYGAHGLWYPTQSDTDSTFWADWGWSPPWWIAMDRPAGAQMQYLRKLYESVNWWDLEPRFGSVSLVGGGTLQDWYQPRAKAAADDVYLVWFPYGLDQNAGFTLALKALDRAAYTAMWFDPQVGSFIDAPALSCSAYSCNLPSRPNNSDWVLVLRKSS